MITIRTAGPAIAVVAVLIASCSSNNTAADSPATTSSTTTAPTSTSSAPAAAGATTEACRSLADDQDLKAFWSDISNTGQTTGAKGMLASMAVMQLGKYTSNPAVDPTVSAAMATAVTEMGDMNQERAGGAPFDVNRFRDIITPIVTACEDAGVDMTVE